jgi:hypothetical protein
MRATALSTITVATGPAQAASGFAPSSATLRARGTALQHAGFRAPHEYVCRKCFTAESSAYYATTPPKTSAAHLPTVVADGSAGTPTTEIDGDTLREGITWF